MIDNLASHIDTPCIEWAGYKDSNGYGRFKVHYKHVPAHRAAWELDCGPIPEGMVVDHLCRTRSCINTDHMEVVWPHENARRGMSPHAKHARKTHCQNGHPFNEKNTRFTGGRRKCRACEAAASRRYKARKEALAKAESRP